MSDKIAVGNRVSIIDEDIEVKVISIENGLAKVEDEHGFEYQYPLDKLVRKDDFTASVQKVHLKDHQEKSVTPTKKEDQRIFDLHFHEISPSDHGYSKHEKLLFQVNFANKELKKARKDGITSVIFIHGVGKGILRTQLQDLVDRLDKCAYQQADWRKFGRGAMEVRLWN